MAAVPLAEAARLLGKPERTIRRWAAQGKLPATRTVDGWLVEIDGQVAATDHAATGQTVGHDAASGGQLAVVPAAHLAALEARAEASAFLAGRLQVLQERVAVLEAQLRALPAPAPDVPQGAPQRESERSSREPVPVQEPAKPRTRAWWAFWRG
jgi:excisionase family DNA binding protein